MSIVHVKTILREYIKEVSKVVEITKREKERINFIINNIEFFIDEWNSKEEKDEKMKKLADAIYKALGGNIT